jgi:acetyltransferase-like isoleucine patch superfamily enzyme
MRTRGQYLLYFFYFFFRTIGAKFIKLFKFCSLKARWKIKNKGNFTFPVKNFPLHLVSVGDFTYGPIDIYFWNSPGEGLVIGKYCSIAADVKFILGGNHRIDTLLSYPVHNRFIKNEVEAHTKGPIVIENDVWIGTDVIILSGLTIGRGCIVAAGSVVTRSFPPYTVIGGNPARVLKSRFDQKVVEELCSIDFDDVTPDFLTENFALIDKTLTGDVLKEINSKLRSKSIGS